MASPVQPHRGGSPAGPNSRSASCGPRSNGSSRNGRRTHADARVRGASRRAGGTSARSGHVLSPPTRRRRSAQTRAESSPAASPQCEFPLMSVRESRNPRASPSGHREDGESVVWCTKWLRRPTSTSIPLTWSLPSSPITATRQPRAASLLQCHPLGRRTHQPRAAQSTPSSSGPTPPACRRHRRLYRRRDPLSSAAYVHAQLLVTTYAPAHGRAEMSARPKGLQGIGRVSILQFVGQILQPG